MDAQLKAKWVEALRSGKYEQGQNALKDENKFCCLGVLCDIQGADFAQIAERYGHLSLSHNPPEFLGSLGSLGTTLSLMNDNGSTFSKIADYIEKNL